jgi:uncharacterized protein YqjF (DUF2071 family)
VRDVVGRIERRILLDHAVEPALVAPHLPPGLEPRLLDGAAVVGVCLIRLVDLRPDGLPAVLGRTVEAAAHRISVIGPGGEPGVFVPRRDTSSWAAVVAGGRVWPGVHGRARFAVARTSTSLRIGATCRDGTTIGVTVDLDGRDGTTLADPGTVSAFHAVERTAWSPDRRGRLEAAVLECVPWRARPIGVTAARSSWIDGVGPYRLAGALLMEGVAARWRGVGRPGTTVPVWPPQTLPTSGRSSSSTSAPSTPS